ncbi:MAG: DoxX family protein [Ignavibacteriaceae bacterium]
MKSIKESMNTHATWAALFISLSVGLIFFTQGILKYTDPNWGVIRFTHIGFPYPDFTAYFVGIFEIVCGLLVTIGLLTRLANVPLLIINLTAIASTKIPELFRAAQGFWFMVSDARTDFAMFTGVIFLLIVGAGKISLDTMIVKTES